MAMSEYKPHTVLSAIVFLGTSALLTISDADGWTYFAAFGFALFIGWIYEQDTKKKTK
jgi:hypothetical protein